jgi:tetratricopeptide (TPR) repeat protein
VNISAGLTVALVQVLALVASADAAVSQAVYPAIVKPGTESATPADPTLATLQAERSGPDESPRVLEAEAARFLAEISNLEASKGPYADELSQQLEGLGALYARFEDYPQAIELFKRAIHVSRINGGLNSPEQVPVTERLIEIYLAQGEVDKADKRHSYLYRIAISHKDSSPLQTAQAMMKYAEWQRVTYLIGLGRTPNSRLLEMHDTYKDVIRLLAATEEEYSLKLVPPLRGLLAAQYLLSIRPMQAAVGKPTLASTAGEDNGHDYRVRRGFLRRMSFKQGKATLAALREIHLKNPASSLVAVAKISVDLGNWLLWNNRHRDAYDAYGQAWSELSIMVGGEQKLKEIFDEPASLSALVNPNTDLGFGSPAQPADGAALEWATILLHISSEGRASKLEVVESQPPKKSSMLHKTLRELSSTRYRPRFVDGKPVDSQIVKFFEYSDN